MGNKTPAAPAPQQNDRSKSQPPPQVQTNGLQQPQAPQVQMMPPWHGPYQLKIKVISGALTKSTDLVTKMSPYPIIEFTRDNTIRTFRGPTHKSGHKSPLWNWDFDLYFGGEPASQVIGAESFKVQVWEEDVITSDDMVGETAAIQLQQFSNGNKTQTQQFLQSQNKPVGTCLLDVQLILLKPTKLPNEFQPGTFSLTLVSAKLDGVTLKRIDSYVVIEINGQQPKRSKTYKATVTNLKAPTWNEMFTYNINSVSSMASTVKITVFHEDPKKSEELGSEVLFYPLLYSNGNGFKDQITLFNKGKAIGKISLSTQYLPIPTVQQASQTPATQTQPQASTLVKQETKTKLSETPQIIQKPIQPTTQSNQGNLTQNPSTSPQKQQLELIVKQSKLRVEEKHNLLRNISLNQKHGNNSKSMGSGAMTNPRQSIDTNADQRGSAKKLEGSKSIGELSMEDGNVLRGGRNHRMSSQSPQMLPSIKQHSISRPRHKSMKQKKRPEWDERFNVDGLYNYTSVHPYYKQFFDKPQRKTPESQYKKRIDLNRLSSIFARKPSIGSPSGKTLHDDDPYQQLNQNQTKISISRNRVGGAGSGSKSFDVGSAKSHLINNGNQIIGKQTLVTQQPRELTRSGLGGEQLMGSQKNLSASRRGGFNSSVINLPDGVYLTPDQKIRLLNLHHTKMQEIEQQRRGGAPPSGSGHTIYTDQVYSKYLNRFRAGGGGDPIKINQVPEASASRLKLQKATPVQMDSQIPQLNKIYNKNVVAVGHNLSTIGNSRNTKTTVYNTEVIGVNRGIPTKAGDFHNPSNGPVKSNLII